VPAMERRGVQVDEMTPVFQTISDPKIGDCMRAATASIFNLKIEQVPHFMMFDGRQWFTVFWYFLLALGYEYHRRMPSL